MLKPQLNQSQSIKTLFRISKPFLHGTGPAFRQLQSQSVTPASLKRAPNLRVGFTPSSNNVKAIFISTHNKTKVKVVITVKPSIQNVFAASLNLELVSAELDPKTGTEKATVKGYAIKSIKPDANGNMTYETILYVPEGFGDVGAVLVQNAQLLGGEEMYLKSIVLDGLQKGPVNVTCDSWIQNSVIDREKRIFFTDKSYLPSQTPNGLKKFRDQELTNLRGNGQGERETSDRIYDYDVYNDLGDPTKSNLTRPVLGGEEHPYPRRCRTGRKRFDTDPSMETRSLEFYVPRDESFSGLKQAQFSIKTLRSVLNGLIPILKAILVDTDGRFPYFTSIDKLFNEGVDLPISEDLTGLMTVLPSLVKGAVGAGKFVLRFDTPEGMDRDKFFWYRDEEFARQTLAGLNPYTIQLVTEWPLRSTLDPEIYGSQESAITKEIVEEQIKGFMTFDEALEQKKLFILDYHDLLLPYVEKVRQLENRTLYGSRTLFFLTPTGILRPIAIELTRPPIDGKPQWKQVYTPNWHSTEQWLWRLAKAQVLAHDSGVHQLASHWLRTHCCVEPYIIATNRQLSAMHPINRLLKPHFRYTMEINALARQLLINAEGIIETTFSPGRYSIELSSVIYDKQWRFDNEALPKNLISRGMAVEDPSAPNGIRLTIEDYPFANDGLDLWGALKNWVTDYVNHYYPDASSVESDEELQAWWTEIRTVGHADKKDEPWWPVLNTPQDLIEIITTIVWVTSGHHAAVNFGQYAYGGYFPNQPTITRTTMPDEDPNDEDWKFFLEKPEVTLLQSFPSQFQATQVMVILDTLSSHSPEEEYLGEDVEPAWREDPVIKAAFERFSGRLKELEGTIDERNADENLRNRNGAGIVPYQLLKPQSGPGVTGKGVPYSISI